MKAMILAAGNGTRLLPLTEKTSKCLLKLGEHSLIEYHLYALAKAGVHEVVINAAKWAKQIQAALGDGSRYGLSIQYSIEETPLETGGGIRHAIGLLGAEPFLVVNADVWTDYPFEQLIKYHHSPLHLVMVNNPEHVPKGDYAIIDGHLQEAESERVTYSGIGIYHPNLFSDITDAAFPLKRVIDNAIKKNQAFGNVYQGTWIDVGTPARYHDLLKTINTN